jgi:hypothetical protein
VSDNYSLIWQAILDRNQVRATYQGRFREMCPHALGTKNGRRQALFFQFAGESNRRLPPGGDWRCLPLDGLADVSLQRGPWYTDERYDQVQTCVGEIDVAVAQL